MIADLRTLADWFPRVWRAAPGWLAFLLVTSPALAFLQAAFPWLWQYAVDALQTEGAVRLPALAAWTAAVGIAHALGYVVLQWARSVRNGVISATIRSALVGAVVRATPAARRGWKTGDLLARIHDDAGEKLSWFLCSGVFRAYEAAWIAVAAVLAMAVTAPSLLWWVAAPLPVVALLQVASQHVLSTRQAEAQRALSATTEVVESTFTTLRVVQAAGLVPLVHRAFLRHGAAQRDAELRASVVSNATALVYQYGWQFALVALLWFGGRAVLAGELTLGEYVTFEGLLSTLIWPMFDLGNLASRLAPTAVSLRRLDEVLAMTPAPVGDRAPADGTLVADGISVVAPDGPTLVRAVSLRVGPGERVAIAGAVGAGKTVLLEALAGVRPVAEGAVTVGGAPLAAAAGAPVAWVPQDPVPLAATVGENVTLGRDLPAEAVAAAIEASQLSRDLARFPQGLDTAVGERGVTMSGGQRQRVALARALAGGPRVLLLDDATSALDAHVEAAVWDALAARGDLAIVLVTHRPRALDAAREVLFLTGGAVVDRGTHRELLARNAAYAAIYASRAEG